MVDWLDRWAGRPCYNGPTLVVTIADEQRFIGIVGFGERDEDAHIRAVGPQHLAGMDDHDARLAAHRGQAVAALPGREPIGGRRPLPLDKQVLHIDVDERRTLGNHRDVHHGSPPGQIHWTFAAVESTAPRTQLPGRRLAGVFLLLSTLPVQARRVSQPRLRGRHLFLSSSEPNWLTQGPGARWPVLVAP